jgi:ATP-dependent DNA helicase 2 subunit 2
MAASGNSGMSFFDRAKNCVSKIIQKKIFQKPNDEIGLILMGSENTENDLNSSLDGYEHIVEAVKLQMPTWEMVRFLDKITPTDFSSDWADGLTVGLNFARNETG